MCIYISAIDSAVNSNDLPKDVFEVLIDSIKACANEYIARRDRLAHPAGTFDSAKRFRLAKRYGCCEGIRSPSRAFPFSENAHGRTLHHVANECGLDQHAPVIRRVVNLFDKDCKEKVELLLRSKAIKRKLLEVALGL